ncbi:4a-hydroxytetrahydrobiopterin dehydratase [Muricauda sp. JGD-17]|uniref:Putative pterin-4-alpha-carbinolamine dehydratase n=1 Tax=Flagellimonas ochracea TaxID=2696472 RepID=A0A964TE38_9FLAO|nr:4a-hydroxytetrahydrobiopterin dehydratase [Allomuricauda ochracea]NAY93238.1 4a-hydroxytetrahydrobiopterin dehydratase [Allomuricauda ochracea]
MEKLNNNQVMKALEKLRGWSLKDGMIVKSFKFKDFKETFSAMTHIAFECEAMNHHPNWENVYNQLTIKLNTHDVGGVTQKDLELANHIEDIIRT